MLRGLVIRGTLIIIVTLAAYGADQKPFIECNPEELVRAVPELAGMQFDSNQDSLDGLLRATGENLGNTFAKLVDISAAEEINELRFNEHVAGTNRREVFRYRIRLLPTGGQELFEEFRIDAKTKSPVQPPASNDFLVVSHFLKLLNYLLPQYQGQSRFRYVGRSNSGGQEFLVVAFAERQIDTEAHSDNQGAPNSQPPLMQGLAWIDAATRQVVRLRVDPLGNLGHFPIETLATDISLIPVKFKSIEPVLWLPSRVTVHASFAGGELHSVHRYSDYQSQSEKSVAVASPSAEDAYEMVARGITLLQSGKPGDAIVALREALRVSPELAPAHFNLANALLTAGDGVGAEAELLEAVKLVPDSGAVHNFLGVVLAKRGDAAGAVAEFRKSAEIQPKVSIVHFNLGQALESLGDRTGALREYQTASELAPDNAVFKTRYEQFEQAARAPSMPSSNISVNVRQVLVPVIVTDKEGRHVRGLKRADFQVFEDGVEQKISAFSVEDAGLSGEPPATDIGPQVGPAATQAESAPLQGIPKPAPVRRTYVICIDSLHSAAGNLMSVRQALLKLFRSERPGDSQYIVLAMGITTQVVQNLTSDAEKVLKAIESKDFQKVFLASRKTSVEEDLLAFRRRVNMVRDECDQLRPECQVDKPLLPPQANQIDSEDQAYSELFLSQLHSLVQQLARATDRRTIVLISDGFQIVPGKQAHDFLWAYFPESEMTFGPSSSFVRMDLKPVLQLAVNSNIPIYTIDSRGLYTSSGFEAANPGSLPRMMPTVLRIMNSAATEAGDTLSEIAAATGGTAFQNSNDILTGLQRAFADGRQYYMLAYVPSNSDPDGKFRAISVRLRDGKMVVKAKRGYWAVAN